MEWKISTDEEIRQIYEQDIAEKSRIVLNKQGLEAFLDGDTQIQDLLDGVISVDDRDFLRRVYENDSDWQDKDKRLTKEEIIELLMEISDE